MNSITQQQNPTLTPNKIYRKPIPPNRIFCHNCNEYTLATEPIVVRRYAYAKFYIIAQCEKCLKSKSVVKSDYEKNRFPSCFYNMRPHKIVVNVLDGKRIIEQISSIING